jgi:hypothetical protein
MSLFAASATLASKTLDIVRQGAGFKNPVVIRKMLVDRPDILVEIRPFTVRAIGEL